MNTHQKVFFAAAVTLGLVAEAFASSAAAPVKAAQLEAITLPPAMVVYHRPAVVTPTELAEITLPKAIVIGHRSDLIASNAKTSPRA